MYVETKLRIARHIRTRDTGTSNVDNLSPHPPYCETTGERGAGGKDGEAPNTSFFQGILLRRPQPPCSVPPPLASDRSRRLCHMPPGRRSGARGGLYSIFMHGRSRMTIDPRKKGGTGGSNVFFFSMSLSSRIVEFHPGVTWIDPKERPRCQIVCF